MNDMGVDSDSIAIVRFVLRTFLSLRREFSCTSTLSSRFHSFIYLFANLFVHTHTKNGFAIVSIFTSTCVQISSICFFYSCTGFSCRFTFWCCCCCCCLRWTPVPLPIPHVFFVMSRNVRHRFRFQCRNECFRIFFPFICVLRHGIRHSDVLVFPPHGRQPTQVSTSDSAKCEI